MLINVNLAAHGNLGKMIVFRYQKISRLNAFCFFTSNTRVFLGLQT